MACTKVRAWVARAVQVLWESDFPLPVSFASMVKKAKVSMLCSVNLPLVEGRDWLYWLMMVPKEYASDG